jgi:hypothetical protein
MRSKTSPLLLSGFLAIYCLYIRSRHILHRLIDFSLRIDTWSSELLLYDNPIISGSQDSCFSAQNSSRHRQYNLGTQADVPITISYYLFDLISPLIYSCSRMHHHQKHRSNMHLPSLLHIAASAEIP